MESKCFSVMPAQYSGRELRNQDASLSECDLVYLLCTLQVGHILVFWGENTIAFVIICRHSINAMHFLS